MEYKCARYDSLINNITTKDRLFAGDYTIDPYQNCEFGCTYCDSAIDKTIYIKTNATQLLNKELEAKEKGIIIVGSVHDPYQNAEKTYKITRKTLNIIQQHGFSCHILTKSNLILRDIDLLSQMNNCFVTISMTTLNQRALDIFEKNVPSSKERLETVKNLSEHGIKTGIAIMPILPFIVEEELEEIIKSAHEYNAQYVIHKHLELKGDQKNLFMDMLKEYYPHLVKKYEQLYGNSYMPDDIYIAKIKNIIDKWCDRYSIKNRI